MPELKYKPSGPVMKEFMRDESFVRGIRGPVGSGKSVGCCIEIFRRALEQKPAPDGIRYSKWVVVRNTNAQLRTTTIATWLQWFPENEWGSFRWSPPFTHHIKFGDVDLEVIFMPLDRPEDVKKLLSLEVTGAWINEAREVPKAIVDGATMRVGRYPSAKDGGPTWHGVIMDTNAPDEHHWWPIMSGEVPPPDHLSKEDRLMLVKPDNWAFYTQPGGMVEVKDDNNELTGYEINPVAENIKNLPDAYYPNQIRGKTKSWINVYVLNRFDTLEDGKPVYQGFTETTHVAKEPLQAAQGVPLVIGVDFGLTPAAAICQRLPNGRWLLLRELVCQDMGAIKFAEQLKYTLSMYFSPWLERGLFEIWGDPAGDFRAQTDERTPFEILRGAGIIARPTNTNDPVIRIESVNNVLSRMVEGNAGLLVDKQACPVLAKGFIGGYHYKRMNVSGEIYDTKPNKNMFSHIHDALQYAMVGAGEGRALVSNGKTMKPVIAKKNFSVWGRHGANAARKQNRGPLHWR